MSLPLDAKAEVFTAALIVDGGAKVLNAYPWDEGMFTDVIALAMYRSCVRLAAAGHKIDGMSVAIDAKKSGDLNGIEGGQVRLLGETTEAFGLSGSVDFYFNSLSELWTRRKVMLATMRGTEAIKSGATSPQEVAETIAEAAKSIEIKTRPTLKDQLGAMLQLIEDNKKRERFPTGLNELDDALDGGYERGELVVFAGETSTGKSVWLQMCAAALGQSGRSVVVYSLEMSAAVILARLSANMASHAILFRGDADVGFVNAIRKAVNLIGGMKLIIRDDMFSLAEIMRDARIQIEAGADAIVIDYIQRVEHTTKENREQTVSEITRQMKRLALQGNVAVLTASQLNEEGKVRESRAIAQDCDILAVIKEGALSLDKFRRGQRFKKIGCRLNGALARFEFSRETEEEPQKTNGHRRPRYQKN